MATMPQPVPQFARRPHHVLATASLVIVFWFSAAALVMAAHVSLDSRSPAASATATIGAVLLTAYCYTRLVAQESGISHALGVGIAWLVLSMVTEIPLAAHLGHGHIFLLGSPDQPLLRNIYLLVWIFAPALFARRESE